MNMNMNT